jgi:hypothetical protein
MRTLAAAGLAGLAAPPDPLSAAADLAVHCWGFCGGWQPERWPIYDALHQVDDWHELVELMQVIRAETRRTEARRN